MAKSSTRISVPSSPSTCSVVLPPGGVRGDTAQASPREVIESWDTAALVAYERTDGQYTLYYSHWGAADLKLKYRITAETRSVARAPIPSGRNSYWQNWRMASRQSVGEAVQEIRDRTSRNAERV
ncbi:DUF6735 family protein [Natrinema salinisoli]|uniref:DUF6735 family protein n=1 Tax=Natrinema salinisoli TaxID=2878535 RepID=UPI0031BB1666